MALVQKTSNLSFPKASELKGQRGLHMLVYAKPGVGKTTLAATAQDHPDGADVLFIDPDRSASLVLSDRSDVSVFIPKDWADLERTLTQITAGVGKAHTFKTIVFDTITAIYYKLIIPSIVGGVDNQVSQPDYGKANRKLIKLVDDMRTLTEQGIHTVFNGHSKEEKESIGESSVINLRLALTPQCQAEVNQSFDHLVYYELNNKGQRILHMQSGRRFDAKYRQPRTGEQMPTQLTDPTFGDIFNHRNSA